eukprot:TRINITY_DN7289_c0_g2_i1.p1 TRINITY_DN7289_c0_g2~~TRINITY_DN7289_c0_g2_i1.p1  ORF type:complete len:614 (-),score=115.37 TRINITY_DN7289_c0_g2_i1:301-2142(-)
MKARATRAMKTVFKTDEASLQIVSPFLGEVVLVVSDQEVRACEEEGESIGTIGDGHGLEILDIGTMTEAGACVKIRSFTGLEGWIGPTALWKNKDATVNTSILSEFNVGEECVALSTMTVRSAEALYSAEVASLDAGSRLKIERLGVRDKSRLCVSCERQDRETINGWVRLVTPQGELLIRKSTVEENVNDNSVSSASTKVGRMSRASRALKSLVSQNPKVQVPVEVPRFFVGDLCESRVARTVRASEDAESDLIGEIAEGDAFEITEIGVDGRCKIVTYTDVEGWICAVMKNEKKKDVPAIGRSTRAQISPTGLRDFFQIGESYSIVQRTILLTSEAPESPAACELKPGMNCKLLSLSTSSVRKGRIFVDDLTGWIHCVTARGDFVIKSEDAENKFAALEAARCGDLETLDRKLKVDGVDVNCTTQRANGMTPLLYAVANGRKSIVEFLLQENFGIDVNYSDHENMTALHHLAKIDATDRDDEVVSELAARLIASRAQADAQEKSGLTPFMVASDSGDKAMVKILTDVSADVAVTESDDTPVMDPERQSLLQDLSIDNELLREDGTEIVCDDYCLSPEASTTLEETPPSKSSTRKSGKVSAKKKGKAKSKAP